MTSGDPLGATSGPARGGWRGVVVAVTVVSLAAAATWMSEPLRLSARAFQQVELWRLWTGHLVHASFAHFAFDMAAAGVLLACFPAVRRLLVLAPLLSVGILLWRSDLEWYVGFSGLLHGLFVWVALDVASHSAGWLRGLALVTPVVLVLNDVLEVLLGHATLESGFDVGARPVPEAHLLGAVLGLAIEGVVRVWRARSAS